MEPNEESTFLRTKSGDHTVTREQILKAIEEFDLCHQERWCKSGLESGAISGCAGVDGRPLGVLPIKIAFQSVANKRDGCTLKSRPGWNSRLTVAVEDDPVPLRTTDAESSVHHDR